MPARVVNCNVCNEMATERRKQAQLDPNKIHANQCVVWQLPDEVKQNIEDAGGKYIP